MIINTKILEMCIFINKIMTIAIYIAGLFPSPSKFPTKAAMKLIGPPLIIVFYAIILACTYTYFFQILPYYEDLSFQISSTIIGLVLLFNLMFNYTTCLLINPGTPFSEKNSPTCNKCKKFKPPRSHHCSICDKCILKMDHHCPWINNCLGFYNHRYFLLFLFYLDFACLFFSIVSYPVVLNVPKNTVLTICVVLSGVFFIVIMAFAGWHWNLAIKGFTTIEYFSEKETKMSFSAGNWKKNLEIVFGTRNLFKMLLPRLEKLNGDGMYWADTIHGV